MNRRASVACAALFCGACGQSEAPPTSSPVSASPARALPTSPAVAWVNGSVISEDDVVRSIVTTLGSDAMARMSSDGRRSVIESLVMSRAIAQAADAGLDPDARLALEAEVAAHREQLLVKRYLRDHAAPRPVTEAMITDYYTNHPERFGGGDEKVIEIVSTVGNLADASRAEALEALAALERQPDWRTYSQRLKARGVAVRYARSVYQPQILDKRLAGAIDRLQEDEVSRTVLIDSVPHRVRLAEVRERAARPLAEVRGEVRRLLLPQQVREAIRQISGTVLADADVRYANAEQDNKDK